MPRPKYYESDSDSSEDDYYGGVDVTDIPEEVGDEGELVDPEDIGKLDEEHIPEEGREYEEKDPDEIDEEADADSEASEEDKEAISNAEELSMGDLTDVINPNILKEIEADEEIDIADDIDANVGEPRELIAGINAVSKQLGTKHHAEIKVVKPEDHLTPNILSQYEMTEIISIRSTQIAKTGVCTVKIDGLDDPILMAKRELIQRKCPLRCRRYVGKKKDPRTGRLCDYYEFISVNDCQFSSGWDT